MKKLENRLTALEEKLKPDTREPIRYRVVFVDEDGNALDGSGPIDRDDEPVIRLTF